MNKPLKPLLWLLLAVFTLPACNTEDPEPENDEELITTVKLTFTPTGSGQTVTGTWQDTDGVGGSAPLVSKINLARNTTYTVRTELLNESASPVQNITQEVESEKEDHQFFYQASGGVFTTATGSTQPFTYKDTDKNGRPVGLSVEMKTGNSAGNGTLKVILRHQPKKDAAGVAAGDITNAGGETDAETTPPFEVAVQ